MGPFLLSKPGTPSCIIDRLSASPICPNLADGLHLESEEFLDEATELVWRFVYRKDRASRRPR